MRNNIKVCMSFQFQLIKNFEIYNTDCILNLVSIIKMVINEVNISSTYLITVFRKAVKNRTPNSQFRETKTDKIVWHIPNFFRYMNLILTIINR